MPSTSPLPNVSELERAFHDGVRGQRDKRSDRHTGSFYDHWAGVAAVLFAREAMRDRDLFHDVYFDFASDDPLTERVSFEYRQERGLAGPGMGQAVVARPTSVKGAGTIFRGSRIVCETLTEGASARSEYAVSTDTYVGPSVLTLPVPIRSVALGVGTAIDVTSSDVPTPRFDDALFDTSFSVVRLTCADGTRYEQDAPLRARARDARSLNRVGYQKSIEDACLAEGAGRVAVFSSYYGGADNDFGINVAYVGDSTFATSIDLIRRCTVRLESARVLGADLSVRPMGVARVKIDATVLLGEDPARINWLGLSEDIKRAIAATFGGSNDGFTYRRDAMAGAAYRVSSIVQSLDFTTPAGDATVLSGSPPAFPATLTHYTTTPSDIVLRPRFNG